MEVGGQPRCLVHFDRNGLGYTLDRVTGELLVAEKYDPTVNWTTEVVMDKDSPTYGRPRSCRAMSTFQNGQDMNTKGICPAALGPKTSSRPPIRRRRGCSTCRRTMSAWITSRSGSYTAGQPYVGATLSMYPATSSHGGMGNFIAWDARRARSSGRYGAVLGLVGRARDGRRGGLLRHAGRLSEGGRREGPARNSSSSRRRRASSATS